MIPDTCVPTSTSVTGSCLSQTYLAHYALELIIRVSIDGKSHTLSLFHGAYIGLIHIGDHLHLGQVSRDGEQGRCLEASRYGLSLFHRFVDHDSINRTGNRRILQVSTYPYHGGLVLLVGRFGLLIVVSSGLVVGLADQLLLMQDLATRVILLLILKLGLAAGQLCLCRTQLSLQVNLIHLCDQLSGLHHIVVVGIELVDDTRHLCTYLYLRHRLHGAGRSDCVRD